MSWFRTRPAAPIIRLYPFTACGLLMVRAPTSDRSVLRPAMLLSSAEMACFSGGDALPVVAGEATARLKTLRALLVFVSCAPRAARSGGVGLARERNAS